MPIKLKKTNIQYDIETPDEGYIILGFDENGNLVTKNDQGDYEPIISDVSTGYFDALDVNILTIGSRVSGSINGSYSISQGQSITAAGDTSFAQGNVAVSSGVYSYARGQYVESSGALSYVAGEGYSSGSVVYSRGNNSFVHMSNQTTSEKGSEADFSAILGGINHKIESAAVRSVILGGNTQTATLSDTVYLPKLVLANVGTPTTQTGMIYYDGTNFQGVTSSGAKKLNTTEITITNPGSYKILTSTSTSTTIRGENDLTWNYSTGILTVDGDISCGGSLSVYSNISTALGNITVSSGNITVSSGNITASSGDLTIQNIDAIDIDISVNSSTTSPLLSLVNAGTGDASMVFTSGGDSFSLGIDNSDSYDDFKLYYGSSLSTTQANEIIKIKSTNLNIAIGDVNYVDNSRVTIGAIFNDPTDRWALTVRNDANDAGARGISIICGEDTPSASNSTAIDFKSGNANSVGSIYFDNAGLHFYSVVSDIRRKINVTGTTINGLDILSNLELIDFNYRKAYSVEVTGETGETRYDTIYTDEYYDQTHVGYIAQDAINVYPKLVKYFEEYDNWAISFDELVPVLHKAILEQQEHIETLEQRIYNLENPV